MGEIEYSVRRKTRRTKVQQAILTSIAMAGLVGIAAVVPNALQILPFFEKSLKRKFNPRYAANAAFKRLLDKGFIEIVAKGSARSVRLTPRGSNFVATLDYRLAKRVKPRRWDKKWRLLIFDIKERRRVTRNGLRRTLEYIGFIRLQNSVWVYPYDCEDIIIMLKADYQLGKDILYIVADRIENDIKLKRLFNLK